MKHIITATIGILTALSLALAPTFALAATSGSATTTVSAAVMTRMKDRGDQEINRRMENLNDVSARVDGIKNLSDADRTSIKTTITNNVTALAQLKTKIDADTDGATLKADVKSITDSYRIFALIIPQIRIIVAADRVVTIANEMKLLSIKLQTRIATAQSAGVDVTAANTGLTDLNAKVADALVQSQAAVTLIATLTPDQGDKTKMASNLAALKTARADVVAAQHDLIAARQDAEKIRLVVKGKGGAGENASSSPKTN